MSYYFLSFNDSFLRHVSEYPSAQDTKLHCD
jgi:hypothetical protein